MRSATQKLLFFALLTSICLTLTAWPAAYAQDAPPGSSEEAKPAKTRAKPRGRLPNHYAKIVTPKQREQIYAIQSKHAEKIDALRAELKALEQALAAEVESVLTPEQRKQLQAILDAAKKPKSAAADSAAAAPATTDAK